MKQDLNNIQLPFHNLNVAYLNTEGYIPGRKSTGVGGGDAPTDGQAWLWDNGENLCWDDGSLILTDE